MFDIGVPELVMILVIALLVFGPGKMAEIGRDLGKTLRDFRRATSDVQKEFNEALRLDEEEKKAAPVWQPTTPVAPAAPAVTAGESGGSPDGRSLAEIAAGVVGGTVAAAPSPAETPAEGTATVPVESQVGEPVAELPETPRSAVSEAQPVTEAVAETVQPAEAPFVEEQTAVAGMPVAEGTVAPAPEIAEQTALETVTEESRPGSS